MLNLPTVRTRLEKLPAWSEWLTYSRLQTSTLRLILALGLILGGAGLIVSNWHTAFAPENALRQTERFWIVVGMGLWFLAITVQPLAPRPVRFKIRELRLPTLFPFAVFGTACVVYLTLRLNPDLEFLGYQSLNRLPPHRDEQLLLLFGGGIMFVIGMMHPDELRGLLRGIWRSLHEQRGEWLIVFLLTLIGFALRLYKLDSLIPIMVSDEPPFAYHARRVIEQRPISLAGDMFYAQNYLGVLLASYSLQIFGVNIFAMRFVVAVIGTLAIPGVYLMARRLLNPLAGTLAAMFLIAQPLHMFFSRTVLYNIWDPTLALYAILLIWHGLEKGGRWKFALAGLLIGTSLYFYTASRLWLIVIPLWLLICLLRQPRQLIRHWHHLIILGISAALVMLPMLALIYQDQYALNTHAVNVSRGQGNADAVFETNLKDFLYEGLYPAVRVFVDRGDSSLHYEMQPYTALNLLFGFMAFSLGVVYALRFATHPYVLLVLMWLFLGLFFGAALTANIAHTRLVTLTLPMAVLAGIGLAWLAQSYEAWLPRVTVYSTVVLLMFAVNIQDAKFILETHPHRYLNDVWIERWIADSLTRETLAVPHNAEIYWIVTPHAWNLRMKEHYGFYQGYIDYQQVDGVVNREWIATLDNRDHDLYIFVPPTPADRPDPAAPPAIDSAIWLLEEFFPEGTWQRFDGRDYPTTRPSALYSLFIVPRGSPNLAQGQP